MDTKRIGYMGSGREQSLPGPSKLNKRPDNGRVLIPRGSYGGDGVAGESDSLPG